MATATPVRKAASRQIDSVEVLVAKITAAIAAIVGHKRLKDDLWQRMNKAADAGNRFLVVGVLADARHCLRQQKALEASGVLPKWQEAIAASVALVRAESINGHNGQKMLELSTLGDEYVAMDERISGFLTSRETPEKLVEDLESLIFEAENYVFTGKWCRTCGDPMSADFKWAYCQPCHNKFVASQPANKDSVESEPVPVHHKVKKPGSAARRLDGPPTGRKPFKKGQKNK